MAEEFKIVAPDLPSDETPPHKKEHSDTSHTGGLSIIQALYDFVTLKEPLAFSVLSRYKIQLDLKVVCKPLYYIFLLISLIFDYFFILLVYLIMSGILIAVFLAFVKGIGIFEWLPQFFGF